MKISYAIPVCNEYKEIEYLLNYLIKHVREGDEIIVQCDEGNTTLEVYKITVKEIIFSSLMPMNTPRNIL